MEKTHKVSSYKIASRFYSTSANICAIMFTSRWW